MRLVEMTEALRASGFRVTPQRRAVLRILAKSLGHPDARRIHRSALRSFPNVSLATVYKTLAALKAAGQVLELEFSGQPNRYDGNRPQPHPHVMCIACGRIVDPESTDLGPFLAAVARETGFTIQASRVDFFGTCPACRRRALRREHQRCPT
jgi:Fur family peroxide stress response transcriptional regulator